MQDLRLSNSDLAKHTGIYADTGGGKSLFIKQYLLEVERRGEMAVVWDPDREYARTFRDVRRGDWILDPTVMECPYWDLPSEFTDEGDAFALASCFFPDRPDVKDPFWNNAARGLFAYLNAYKRPSTADLGYWMAHDYILDKLVQGSEFERILSSNAPGMRSSVISHMNLTAQPLRMMPPQPDGRRQFSIRDWSKKRDSWIFITSTPSYSDALKPLHSAWMSSIIMRLIDMGRQRHLPRVHIIFEEASTITVQAFHLGLVRLRKTDTPVVFAIQNFADFKAAYGDKAETIYSQPYTKIFFRISSDESAKKAENTAGQTLRKFLRETYSHGRGAQQRSYTIERKLEPCIPQDEILNLEDRCGYLLQPGVAVPFKIPVVEIPDRKPAIIMRAIPPMERRPIEPQYAPDAPIAEPKPTPAPPPEPPPPPVVPPKPRIGPVPTPKPLLPPRMPPPPRQPGA